MTPLPEEEDPMRKLRRLLRESRERDAVILAQTRKAIDESLELLQRVERLHPRID